ELAEEYGFASKEDFFTAYNGQVDEAQMKEYFLQEEVIKWVADHAVQVDAADLKDEAGDASGAETAPEGEASEDGN
ncbi:MAG: hypothetical protein K5707_09260, partial [Clostridia bacterium]|nr:hypothetical protein [Clostridia bacterium]